MEDRLLEIVRQADEESEQRTLTVEKLRAYLEEARAIVAQHPEYGRALEGLSNLIQPEWFAALKDLLDDDSDEENEEDGGGGLRALLEGVGAEAPTTGDFVGTAEAEKATDADYEDDVQVRPEQLSPHDMDLPEEPEVVRIITRTYNPATNQWEQVDLGPQLLIPTGCEDPEYLNPFENKVTFKSALPRDLAADTNLYSTWQQNGWIDRRYAQEHLDAGIKPTEVNKRIADDIPFINALAGRPDPTAQVAQTEGLSPGSNNGAPLPPGPGPGRGNRFAPGDNKASPPPDGKPGRRM